MATYYISPNGNDQNDGLSPQTAWQTVCDLDQRVPGGSTVKIERGGLYYGSFAIPSSDDPHCPTVITAYGEGDKPQLSQYKVITREDAWTEVSPHIWRVDLTDPTFVGGNMLGNARTGSNVGFLLADGEIRGEKRWSVDELSPQEWWQFYSDRDSGLLFVTANRNPCTYGTICVAVGGGIRLGNNCVVEDLDLFGGGTHGVTGNVHNAVVRRLDVHDFGGAHLWTDSRPHIRFGNGMEFWSGGEDILIEDCKIYNIYDVGVTMQGFPEEGKGWKRVVYRRNLFWGSQQSFEIWTNNAKSDEGMTDCRFEQNICIGSGLGWSYASRPDKNNGSHLLFYNILAAHHGITVENNVFYNTRRVLYHNDRGPFPKGYVTRNNHIFLRPDCYFADTFYTCRATELEKFQREAGMETGSTVELIDKPETDLNVLIPRLQKLLEK